MPPILCDVDLQQWTAKTDLLVGVVICVIAVIVSIYMSRRRGTFVDAILKRSPISSDLSPSGLAFYALKPCWTRFDRFYKVYITKDGLLGAWVGGQFHDDASVRYQIGGTGPLAARVSTWVNQRREKLEAHYDALVSAPEIVLQNDSRNFLLPKSDIRAIRITRRPSLWTGRRDQGSLSVERCMDGRMTFILWSGEDALTVGRKLAANGYAVEMEWS